MGAVMSSRWTALSLTWSLNHWRRLTRQSFPDWVGMNGAATAAMATAPLTASTVDRMGVPLTVP